MKKLLYILAVAGVVAFACYTLPEGMKRQAIVDCWKAEEICEKYYYAHSGDCLECRKMKQCEIDGLFDE